MWNFFKKTEYKDTQTKFLLDKSEEIAKIELQDKAQQFKFGEINNQHVIIEKLSRATDYDHNNYETRVRIYKINSFELLNEITVNGEITQIFPDGTFISVNDISLYISKLNNGSKTEYKFTESLLQDPKLISHGTRIATLKQESILIYDLESKQLVYEYEGDETMRCLEYSEDTQCLYALTNTGIEVVDVSNPDEPPKFCQRLQFNLGDTLEAYAFEGDSCMTEFHLERQGNRMYAFMTNNEGQSSQLLYMTMNGKVVKLEANVAINDLFDICVPIWDRNVIVIHGHYGNEYDEVDLIKGEFVKGKENCGKIFGLCQDYVMVLNDNQMTIRELKKEIDEEIKN